MKQMNPYCAIRTLANTDTTTSLNRPFICCSKPTRQRAYIWYWPLLYHSTQHRYRYSISYHGNKIRQNRSDMLNQWNLMEYLRVVGIGQCESSHKILLIYHVCLKSLWIIIVAYWVSVLKELDCVKRNKAVFSRTDLQTLILDATQLPSSYYFYQQI